MCIRDSFLQRPGVVELWDDGQASHTEDTGGREGRVWELGQTLGRLEGAPVTGVQFLFGSGSKDGILL